MEIFGLLLAWRFWRAPIQEVGGFVLSTREDDKHARGGLEHVGSPIVCFIEKAGEKGKYIESLLHRGDEQLIVCTPVVPQPVQNIVWTTEYGVACKQVPVEQQHHGQCQ